MGSRNIVWDALNALYEHEWPAYPHEISQAAELTQAETCTALVLMDAWDLAYPSQRPDGEVWQLTPLGDQQTRAHRRWLRPSTEPATVEPQPTTVIINETPVTEHQTISAVESWHNRRWLDRL